ncbi:hypothetical protein DH2020_026873 [Rehmannia glutinosa]|uniref:Kinesin-like protein n=1 Tax=Rehmannia glutinosa TaxID=99300 RepID=A0ABR0VYL4_REHGL
MMLAICSTCLAEAITKVKSLLRLGYMMRPWNYFYEFFDGKTKKKVGCVMLMDGGDEAERAAGFDIVGELPEQGELFTNQTLEALCSDFDQAVTLSGRNTGQFGGNDDLVDSSEDHRECSNQVQTLPIFQKIEDLSNKVQIIRKEHALLCSEAKGIIADSLLGSEAFSAVQNLSTKYELLKKKYHEECALLKKKYIDECSERKKLYNEVIELKGNIRVFCRCRPLMKDEIANGSTSVVDFDSSQENELQITCSDSSRKLFKFDHVFKPEDNQEAVFVQTLPIVTSVLMVTTCAYLPTDKQVLARHTQWKEHQKIGVNYRTLDELFRVSNERRSTMRYELFVSMLEVYNEKIRDLLVGNSNEPAKKLEIKQSAEGTQEVPGLVETRVYGTDEVWGRALIRKSRENLINGQRTRSHLWLVDLAGSERVSRTEVEGDRLKESQFINKSLSALGDVIFALASKTNSKLTHMLQSSLGGDCKTLMFVQISPNVADLGETLCSLNFASRVRGVEHGPARRQTDHTELLKYKQLAEKAKQDEKETKKLQDSLQFLQLRLASREHSCRNLQEKVRDLENQLAEERKTRLKQENRVLASISTQSALSTSNQAQKTSTDRRPPLAPSNLRLPSRITNFMPVPSPVPPNRTRMSFLPVVNEDKENISRKSMKEKPIFKARRGSIAVRPPPPTTSQVRQPKRRASIATLRSEFNTNTMTTPLHSSTVRLRNDRVMGRQSFVWDPQRVWRTSRVSSPLPHSREQLSTATIEATPIGPRSSKFKGSPPSQAGSWRPKHPTVVALQKKHLVWSPLKLRGMKNNGKSLLST